MRYEKSAMVAVVMDLQPVFVVCGSHVKQCYTNAPSSKPPNQGLASYIFDFRRGVLPCSVDCRQLDGT